MSRTYRKIDPAMIDKLNRDKRRRQEQEGEDARRLPLYIDNRFWDTWQPDRDEEAVTNEYVLSLV